MNNLLFGGSPVLFTRDTGTPGTVQGFVNSGVTIGATLASALPTSYIFNAIQRSMEIVLDSLSGTEVWVNIGGGVWKQGVPWINIGGGIWKEGTGFINIGSGVWKG